MLPPLEIQSGSIHSDTQSYEDAITKRLGNQGSHELCTHHWHRHFIVARFLGQLTSHELAACKRMSELCDLTLWYAVTGASDCRCSHPKRYMQGVDAFHKFTSTLRTLEEIFGWKMNSNSKYLTVQVISKVIRNSIDDSSSSPRWGDDDDGLRTNPNKPGVGTDHVW